MKFFLLMVLFVISTAYSGLAQDSKGKVPDKRIDGGMDDNLGQHENKYRSLSGHEQNARRKRQPEPIPKQPVHIVKKVEISDEAAVKLCTEMRRQQSLEENTGNYIFNTSYLWVQIRQQVAGKPNGIVLDSPMYPTGCLKWKLKRCRGTEIWPLMRPCTFWDPVRKNTKFCRSVHAKTYKYVLGRPPGAVPGNCMCDLPCEEKYDPYQVCRAELNTIPTTAEPQQRVEIDHYKASQLCRSVDTSRTMGRISGILLSWLPIRIQNAMFPDPDYNNRPCPAWAYTPCENGTSGVCGEWEKIERDTPCESVAPNGKPDPFPPIKQDSPCLRNEFPFPDCPSIESRSVDVNKPPGTFLDGGCVCQYPCLPYFDAINRCYYTNGQPIVGVNKERILPAKNFMFSNEKGIIRCTMWEEEITCGVLPPYKSSRESPLLPETTVQGRRNMRARRMKK